MMGLGHEAGVLSGVCLHKAHLRTEIDQGSQRDAAVGAPARLD